MKFNKHVIYCWTTRLRIVGGSWGVEPPVGGLNPPAQFMSIDAHFEWKSALNFNPWAKCQTFRHLTPSSFMSILTLWTTRAKISWLVWLAKSCETKNCNVSFITNYWQLWNSTSIIACVQNAFLWLWHMHWGKLAIWSIVWSMTLCWMPNHVSNFNQTPLQIW